MASQIHRIDKSSPVPIYFQIAEAIRWQISTGQMKPGDALLSTRQAATIWDVNRHTIRRAYHELAELKLIEKQGTSRMIVATSLGIQPDQRRLNSFVDHICKQAQEEFKLSPLDLSQVIVNRVQAGSKAVTMVECNHYQCFDLKRQLEQRFDISVTEFLLSQNGEPPPGPIIGTVFHFNEICARWPNRRHEMRFGGLYVNPQLGDRIARCCKETKRTRSVLVHSHRHETDAFNLATDLEMALHNHNIRISPCPDNQSVSAMLSKGNVVTVAPWNWDDLSALDRSHSRCFLLEYCLDPIDIESIGANFGWFDRIRAGAQSG